MPTSGRSAWPIPERIRLPWKVGAALLRLPSVFVSTRLLSKSFMYYFEKSGNFNYLKTWCTCISIDTNSYGISKVRNDRGRALLKCMHPTYSLYSV